MQTDFQKTGKLYPKIDIYRRDAGGWVYVCSTQQWRLCRDARQAFCNIHNDGQTSGYVARFHK